MKFRVIFFIHIICLFNFIQGAQALKAAGGAGSVSEVSRPRLIAVLYVHQVVGSPVLDGATRVAGVKKLGEAGIDTFEVDPAEAVTMPLSVAAGEILQTLYGFKYDNGVVVPVNQKDFPKPPHLYQIASMPLFFGDVMFGGYTPRGSGRRFSDLKEL
jgi:hypothetical protein